MGLGGNLMWTTLAFEIFELIYGLYVFNNFTCSSEYSHFPICSIKLGNSIFSNSILG